MGRVGRVRVGWLLAAGYLAQVALRLAISVGRDGPTNFADETGYLANARVLAGGVEGELSRAAFYRGGYSLLLLPASWLGDGPRAEYLGVLATNALVSALVFPLLYLLLARVFGVPRPAAAGAAFLAALYPPLVVTTQFAWAESLLAVLVLVCVVTLAAVAAASRPRVAAGWAVACGACAGALYSTHGRTVPLVALAVAALAALAVVRRELAGAAAAGVATAVAALAAGQWLNDWLQARSWGPLDGGDLERVLDNARDPGALAGVRRWPGWAAGRDRAGAPLVAGVLLGSTAGLAAVVGWFLLPPWRPDHVVYGRYVEILVPPLLALGLVRLWTAAARRVALELAAGTAAALAAGLVASWYAGGLVRRGPVNWYTVLALPPLAQTREQIRPLTATLAAVAAALALLVTARRWRALAAAGLAVVLAASAVAVRVVLVEARDRAVHGSQPVALSRVDGIGAARAVGYDLAAYTPVGLYGYQWQLDRARFVLFDSRRDPPPATEWVLAGLDWPQARRVGARRVWVHPAYGQALWRLPAPGPGYASPASPSRGTTSSGSAARRSSRAETPPSSTRRSGP